MEPPSQVAYSPKRSQPAPKKPEAGPSERTTVFRAQTGRAVPYHILLQNMIWGKPLGPREDHLPSPASFTRRTERIPPLEVHASPRGNQPTPLPSTVKHQTSMSVGWAKKNKLVPFLCTVSAGEHRHSSTHTHTELFQSFIYGESWYPDSLKKGEQELFNISILP